MTDNLTAEQLFSVIRKHARQADRTRARLLVRALRLRAEMHAAWDTRHNILLCRQSRSAADAIEAKYLKETK